MKSIQPKGSNPLSIASKKNDSCPVKLLNAKREELTPQILKTFPGYENLSDEEAEEKCTAIKSFARLLFQHLSSVENDIYIDNQQVITLSQNENQMISIDKNKVKIKAA